MSDRLKPLVPYVILLVGLFSIIVVIIIINPLQLREKIIATSIVGLFFLKLLNQLRTVKQIKRTTIVNQTIMLGQTGSYYKFSLSQHETLRGTIYSDNAIDMYILDETNFEKWVRKDDFVSEECMEDVIEQVVDFSPPNDSRKWYLVLTMSGKGETIEGQVDVNLFLS